MKTPFRSQILAMVDSDLSGSFSFGCVLASCHSPWIRLLAEWCRVHDFAMVVAGADWIDRRAPKLRAADGGFAPVRQLVRHLQSGGRVIILADGFGNSRAQSAAFLGMQCAASLFPARLAAAGGVPLQIVIPLLEGGLVRAMRGPRFQVHRDRQDQAVTTEQTLKFLEEQIRSRPSLRSRILRAAGAS